MTSDASARKILIVEDELVIRNLCRRIIQGKGIELYFTSNVQGALNAIEQMDRIDMLITDLKLPDGDGTTVISHFHERFSKSRILVMTGSLSPEQKMEHVHQMGVVDVIFKPFNIKDFETTVMRILEFS